MDLLLVKTHRHVSGHLPGSNLGMNILRQILTKQGYVVREIQDYGEAARRAIGEAMRSSRPPRVIGFYCDFNNAQWVRILAAAVKRRYPGLVLIAGGPQAVGFDAEYMEKAGLSAACIGEAEETLPELLGHLLHGRGRLEDIQGIVYPDGAGGIAATPARRPVDDLDSIPWPNLDETADFGRSSLLPLLTGRGCPFGCTFCYEGANAKRIRRHSVAHVLQEIADNLKKNPNIRYINFLDDTFTLDRQRVADMCAGIRELRRDYDFVWFASAHMRTVLQDPGMLDDMLGSGLKKIFFGLEAGDDAMLRQYNKGLTRDMILDTVHLCRRAGLPSMAGNFLLGGPFETPETVQASVTLAEQLLTDAPGRFEAAFFSFLPYPNTPITNAPERFGMTVLADRIDCGLEDIPLSRTGAMDFDDLLRARLEANRSVQHAMSALYESGAVPDDEVLDNYRLHLRYGIYTRWRVHAYSRNVIDDAYWTMRAGGRYITSSEAGSGISRLRPVRTFELWLHVDGSGERPAIFGRELGELEFLLLTMCGGRIDQNSLIARAAGKYGAAASDDGFTARARAALATLERKRWILYAKS